MRAPRFHRAVLRAADFALVAACIAIAACTPKPTAQSPCDSQPNLVLAVPSVRYAHDPSDVLDLYLPFHKAGEPLLVYVHGGGWTSGDKHSSGHIGRYFARCGIAFANIDYPLATRVRVEAQAAAVLDAARYLANRAAVFGFAGDRVFLLGHSAGANIVTLAVLGSPAVRPPLDPNISGVIVLDGLGFVPSPSEAKALRPDIAAGYRSAFGPNVAAWARYNVEARPPKHAPPFLIVHGTDDDVVAESDSVGLTHALERSGIQVRYLQAADRNHISVLSDMARDPQDPTGIAVEDFILSGTP